MARGQTALPPQPPTSAYGFAGVAKRVAKRVAGATLYLLVHACTDVHGGAVELSWRLRTASGASQAFVDCDTNMLAGTVTGIQLGWQVGDVTGSRTFACHAGHGVTGFELPAGDALLTVKPMCGDVEAPPTEFTAPAPIGREVITGDTVSLGAVELVVQVTNCGIQPCICF